MTDSKLFEILAKWNFWGRAVEPGFPRDLTPRILDMAQGPEVIAVKGVRRSGKSTILFQIIDALIRRGVPPEAILYVNFEEPLFFNQREQDILDRLFAFYRERLYPQGVPYVFLDEIQEIPAWEKWARARTDLREAKLFVTGSSSALLSGEYGTLLTGRHVSFTVYPLSFREFLRMKGVDPSLGDAALVPRKPLIRNLLREFLHYGGFPEVVLKERDDIKERLLKQYFDDILYRDIVWRYKVRDIETLKNVAALYMTGIATLTSYNKTRNTLDVPLDVVRNYTGYLAESYLIKETRKHSFKVKEQLRSPKKTYAIDTGLRNAVSYRFSEDLGRLAENAVCLELLRREKELDYYKDRGEVDFLVRAGIRTDDLVQVCMATPGETAWEREVKALDDAMAETGLRRGVIVTDDDEQTFELSNGTVQAVPLWKWLIG